MRADEAMARWALAIAFVASAQQAHAQSLDNVSVAVQGRDVVARVRFDTGVRLLQQAPDTAARSFQFQIEPSAADTATPTQYSVDLRRVAPTGAAPAFTVVLNTAQNRRTQQLTLQLAEATQVRVLQGPDPATIDLVLVGKGGPEPAPQTSAGRYAVRLASGPVSAMNDIPAIPSRFQDFEVSETGSAAETAGTIVVELGYFATAAAAEAARKALLGRFPDAIVVNSPAQDEAPTQAARNTSQPTESVVNVRLNGVAKGDLVAYLTADRDVLLLPHDLSAMGVPHPAGRSVQIAGESYLSLKSIAGAELKFDEKALTLDLHLPPRLLPDKTVNLGATLPSTPVQRRTPGGFLNYRLEATKTGGGPDSIDGTTELGLNLGQFLLLDNRNFTSAPGQPHAVRLQTQLVYDQPQEFRRWILGDVFASSGPLGSSVNLGGISVSKLYQINPYFVRTPLAAFAGAVTLPSTVDIYMNGTRVRSQTVAPGNFNLQNIDAYGASGLRNVEVVITDPFGRQQRVGFPYFFSDQLLAKGLDEYSVNVGFMRENFGVASSAYGSAVVSAFQRYGLSNTLTTGLSGDATRDHVNMGASASLNTVKAGVISAGLSFSRDRGGRSGMAGSADHSFLFGPFSSQISVRRFSEDYSILGSAPSDQPKLQGSASIAYGNAIAGTFSLSYLAQTVFGGATDQQIATLGYTRMLGRDVSLVANLSRVTQGNSGYAAYFGLSYFPGGELSANASHERTAAGDTTSQLQVARAVPVGEGLGWRLNAQHAVAAGVTSDTVSPFAQYNARAAILTAQGTNISGGGSSGSGFYQLSLAGAAAYIGNGIHLSRPIDDSYALVRIEPPLAGVRVLKSNAEIGVTDAAGAVFVPNLGSYQVNDVAIQPKDIPLDYTIALSGQKVRPPLRSGVVATFAVKRVRAITGSLKLRDNGKVSALEGREVVLAGASGSASISTIRNGDFYVENLAPGVYAAQLKVGGKTCTLELTVPDSQEIVTELGDVFCETVH